MHKLLTRAHSIILSQTFTPTLSFPSHLLTPLHMHSLIWHGWRKPLLYSDLTDLNEEDKAKRLGPKFQKNWDQQLKKSGSVGSHTLLSTILQTTVTHILYFYQVSSDFHLSCM